MAVPTRADVVKQHRPHLNFISTRSLLTSQPTTLLLSSALISSTAFHVGVGLLPHLSNPALLQATSAPYSTHRTMFLFMSIFFAPFLALPSLASSSIHTIPCPPLLSNSTCGELTVPLDHANPSTTINISTLYVITTPSVPTNFTSALLVVPGGPGCSALRRPPKELMWLEFVNALKRPVVFFDPRGTGIFSRLNCSLQQEPFAFDLDLLHIRRCLSEIGEELFHYSVTAIVNDLEVLRVALGLQQWHLFGLSYGTLISQAYGVLYPHSVRSMLLDSPVPMRLKDLYQVRHHQAYARIHAQKNKNNPNFSKAEFNNQLNTVLRRLRWNSALRRHLNIDARLLFHMYRFTSASFADAIASAAVENNYTGLQQIAHEMEPQVFALRNFSVAMSIATLCNSMVDMVPWDPDAGFLERLGSLVYDVLRKVGLHHASPFYMTEAFESPAKQCPAMPPTQLRREGLPLDSGLQKDIPALVLVGDLDPRTPLEDVVDLDPVFRRNVAVVKGADHGVSEHPCGLRLFLEFTFGGSVSNFSLCE